jgi:glucosamine--fructose-6-phosphate aminotransferase (isomerizing)
MEEILSHSALIKKCAEKYTTCRNFVFMARGVNVASAQEGALKLKEISYINANAYAAGELKHGPIALLDEDVPVLSVLLANTPTYEKMLSNCEEAKARHAKLIAVTSAEDLQSGGLFDSVLTIPQTAEIFSPILVCVPLQLLAYYMADALGREVDQPRNLAKSVTVE